MNRKNTIRTVVLAGLLLPGLTLRAQAVADSVAAVTLPDSFGKLHVSAMLDTARITVGEQLTLHIVADGVGSLPLAFPTPEELTTGAIEALESKTDTTRDAAGVVTRLEQRVTLTSFEAGRHAVGVVVRVESPQGALLLAPADSLLLEVAYAESADTTKCEVRGDVPSLREPYTFWEVARWVVYALLAAAVVATLVWVLKRRKEHKPIVVLPKAKPVPADRRALNELESLRRKELWQKGRVKKYYTDMTDIVRRFLRNMYGITAGEMTTRQTLRAFHGISDWSEESETLLRQLLQKADMVKFAKSQPEAFEHDQAMQYAVDFVRAVAEQHRINNPENEGSK